MHIDTTNLVYSMNGNASHELVALKLHKANLAQAIIDLDHVRNKWADEVINKKLWLYTENTEHITGKASSVNDKINFIRKLYRDNRLKITTVILNNALQLAICKHTQIVPCITWQGLISLAILFADDFQISINHINHDTQDSLRLSIYRLSNTRLDQNELSVEEGGNEQPIDILTIIYRLDRDVLRPGPLRQICEELEKIALIQLDQGNHLLTKDYECIEPSVSFRNQRNIVIFFPHNPAYRRTGAHQLILLRIQAMLELGTRITFISTVAFTDTKWDDWSINYLLSIGICRVEIIQDAIVDQEHRAIQRETWSSKYFEAYTPPYLTLRVKQILSEVRPECFYINYAYWAELTKVNSELGSINILDLHDFLGRSIILSKDAMQYGNSSTNLLPAEILAFTKVDKIIAVSRPDFNQLKETYRPNNLFYLPVAPKAKPRCTLTNHGNKKKFVFVGSKNNINVTSMMFFINETLPLILQLNNDFELQLYGSICECVPKVKGINACGWQPEEVIYNMDAVLLAPLISSTGMQVKIAEAFCNAAPVICYSTIAVQNEVVSGYNGIVAQNSEELSKACLLLDVDNDFFQRCQNGAEETSNRRYELFKTSLHDILFGGGVLH
jgi:hypothetical protein